MVNEITEKPFESDFTSELSPYLEATDQSIEKVLGYDAFGNVPLNNKIWSILKRFPQGVTLSPQHWNGAPAKPDPNHPSRPTQAVNLMLQFKRSRYIESSGTMHYKYWGKPYYRYELDNKPQLFVLWNLQSNLGGQAIVRYVAPCFHTYDELRSFRKARTIVANSNFVSPFALIGHKYWTYIGPGTSGIPNPPEAVVEEEPIIKLLNEGMGSPSQSVEAVTNAISSSVEEEMWPRVREHPARGALNFYRRHTASIQNLQELLKDAQRTWTEEFDKVLSSIDGLRSEEDRRLVRDALVTNQLLDMLNLRWILVFSPND